MTIDELQNKPAILEGLVEYLRDERMKLAIGGWMGSEDVAKQTSRLARWQVEIIAIQSAITQVGEEE